MVVLEKLVEATVTVVGTEIGVAPHECDQREFGELCGGSRYARLRTVFIDRSCSDGGCSL